VVCCRIGLGDGRMAEREYKLAVVVMFVESDMCLDDDLCVDASSRSRMRLKG